MTRREWLRKYPKHCKNCEARTDSANPCQKCLGMMLCPRCTSHHTLHPYDASVPCTACGWVETEDYEHGAPMSRQDKKMWERVAEEEDRRDRERRITEARQTLKELGAK
jgi:hypothetical protein